MAPGADPHALCATPAARRLPDPALATRTDLWRNSCLSVARDQCCRPRRGPATRTRRSPIRTSASGSASRARTCAASSSRPSPPGSSGCTSVAGAGSSSCRSCGRRMVAEHRAACTCTISLERIPIPRERNTLCTAQVSRLATSRAQSTKSRAEGLGRRFLNATIPIGPPTTGSSTGSLRMKACGVGNRSQNSGTIER